MVGRGLLSSAVLDLGDVHGCGDVARKGLGDEGNLSFLGDLDGIGVGEGRFLGGLDGSSDSKGSGGVGQSDVVSEGQLAGDGESDIRSGGGDPDSRSGVGVGSGGQGLVLLDGVGCGNGSGDVHRLGVLLAFVDSGNSIVAIVCLRSRGIGNDRDSGDGSIDLGLVAIDGISGRDGDDVGLSGKDDIDVNLGLGVTECSEYKIRIVNLDTASSAGGHGVLLDIDRRTCEDVADGQLGSCGNGGVDDDGPGVLHGDCSGVGSLDLEGSGSLDGESVSDHVSGGGDGQDSVLSDGDLVVGNDFSGDGDIAVDDGLSLCDSEASSISASSIVLFIDLEVSVDLEDCGVLDLESGTCLDLEGRSLWNDELSFNGDMRTCDEGPGSVDGDDVLGGEHGVPYIGDTAYGHVGHEGLVVAEVISARSNTRVDIRSDGTAGHQLDLSIDPIDLELSGSGSGLLLDGSVDLHVGSDSQSEIILDGNFLARLDNNRSSTVYRDISCDCDILEDKNVAFVDGDGTCRDRSVPDDDGSLLNGELSGNSGEVDGLSAVSGSGGDLPGESSRGAYEEGLAGRNINRDSTGTSGDEDNSLDIGLGQFFRDLGRIGNRLLSDFFTGLNVDVVRLSIVDQEDSDILVSGCRPDCERVLPFACSNCPVEIQPGDNRPDFRAGVLNIVTGNDHFSFDISEGRSTLEVKTLSGHGGFFI